MRFFVSYTTTDGEGYARRLKQLLAPTHEAWVWAVDHTTGVPTWREIARQILARDIFLCILTPGSADSAPQVREVNLALNNGKRIITLKHEDAPLYPELGGENYERFSDNQFDGFCYMIAARAGHEATLAADPTVSGVAKRLRFIQGLRARTAGLRQEVLDLASREAQEAYQKATLPREVVRFTSQTVVNEDFRVISVEETRKLHTFNDPSYIWSMYFEECGRAVASGEKNGLIEALVSVQEASTIHARDTDNRFILLDELIEELTDAGFRSQTLLAPVGDLPKLYQHFGNRVAWPEGRRELLMANGGALRIIWSSKVAPLEHYILLRPEVGLWQVVPDPDTGKALTVAVGINELYDDLINIVVQTMARFDVLDPQQMRIMRVPSATT
jgi:hypothetical protein